MYSYRVNTITSAQMAVKLLKSKGIKSKIGRIKKPSKSDGCGYTVDVLYDNYEEIKNFLEEKGIAVSGIDML